MSQWQNDDGLTVKYLNDNASDRAGVVKDFGPFKQLVVEFDYANLPTYTTDLNNDGTNNGFNLGDNAIPANASIVEVQLVVGTAWAGLTAMDIGLYQLDGTVIDADGLGGGSTDLDAADLTAGAVIGSKKTSETAAANVLTGAKIGTTIGANAGYLVVAAASASAGTAKLVITYSEKPA